MCNLATVHCSEALLVVSQLSVVHSRPDEWKEAGRTENLKIHYQDMHQDGKFIYVYLKVTKGHNSISSWCSATKPGVSCPHMQVHIPVKCE